MHKTRLFLLLTFLGSPGFSEGTPFLELIPVSYYGWLDQYSITDEGFVGREACVPTSSTNALTFMQNINPSIFGTQLSGTTYEDWKKTDKTLISLMGTTVGSGTNDDRLVWGLDMYLSLTHNFPQVQFSGIFHGDVWQPDLGYPKPSFIQDGAPNIAFLANALGAGSAVLVGIEYNDGFTGGGHELLFNGLSWDPATNTGIAYFVDPLDPSQNYSPDVPTGPVKQTTGILSVNPDGSLELQYNQYHGTLPYTDDYLFLDAKLTSVLSVGGSFYAPYAEGSKNVEAIIEGFEELDPTTSAMFPILAVLNTTANLEDAFDQFDPSVYNVLTFSEEAAVHQVQTVLNNHLLEYRGPCGCLADGCPRAWGISFENCIEQQGGRHYANSGYTNSIGGGVIGLDFLACENLLTGCGFSYAHTNAKWSEADAKSAMDTFGAIFYTAFACEALLVDASLTYAYSKASGHRNVFVASAIPFIDPIQETIHHKNHSNAFACHLGAAYELPLGEQFQMWPFWNEDFINIRQSSIREQEGGILDLHIHKKSSGYLRSEAGLGFSYYFCGMAFLHTKLSYANEYRFNGKKTKAYFDDTPASQFAVTGRLPQHNLFCATVLLGTASVCEIAKANLAYHGEFGAKYSSNEISAELNLAF